MKPLHGLVAAAHTPMLADGRLHLDAIGPLVELFVADGVDGLYVLGSTGEGISLASAERRDVAAEFVAAAAGRLPVVVQVGHNSLAESRQLAAHAQQIGADAISATPPMYFKPNSVEVLVDCLAEVTGGAPELPFYYYHIPRMTGVDVSMLQLLRIGADRIATLAGIKYSMFDQAEMLACLRHDGGRFDILFGSDEQLLAALATGVRGAVGTTYSFAAPLYRRIIEAFDAGQLEQARQLQALSVEMVYTMVRYRAAPAFKAVMKQLGVDCGPTRLPLVALTEAEQTAMQRDLQRIGFFDWART